MTTPKTTEQKILEEFEEKCGQFFHGFIGNKENILTWANAGEKEVKDFILSSLTSLREQIAKEDVEWAERQMKETNNTGNYCEYNEALSDFISYKHNQIK